MGDNYDELKSWCPLIRMSDDYDISKDLVITTLEDTGSGHTQVPHVVTCGDWVAMGQFCEFYPIKDWIFVGTYEEVG